MNTQTAKTYIKDVYNDFAQALCDASDGIYREDWNACEVYLAHAMEVAGLAVEAAVNAGMPPYVDMWVRKARAMATEAYKVCRSYSPDVRAAATKAMIGETLKDCQEAKWRANRHVEMLARDS